MNPPGLTAGILFFGIPYTMKWFDYPAKIMSTLAMVIFVFGGIWSIAADDVGAKILQITGIQREIDNRNHEFNEFRAEMRRSGGDLSRQLDEVRSRLEAVEPIPNYLEFDMLRSRILEPCPKDGKCTYTIRYRRTELGRHCVGQNLQRIVVDSAGQAFVVKMIDEAPILQGNANDWLTVSRTFILPEEAAAGIAEFYIVGDYRRCELEHPEITIVGIKSSSLIFTIKR